MSYAKFSEDIIPVTDLKINPGKIINQTKETHRPILLTNRGRGVAVVQSVVDYEKQEEERAFVKAIAKGLLDIENGNEVPLKEVKAKFSTGK